MLKDENPESYEMYHKMYLEARKGLEETIKKFNIPISEGLVESLMEWTNNHPIGGYWSKEDMQVYNKYQQEKELVNNIDLLKK